MSELFPGGPFSLGPGVPGPVGLGPKEDRRGCGLLSRVAPSSAYSPASQALGSPAWGFRPAGRTAEGGDLPSLTQASSSLLLSLLLIPVFRAGELVVRKAAFGFGGICFLARL